jgi:hypothetical protein
VMSHLREVVSPVGARLLGLCMLLRYLVFDGDHGIVYCQGFLPRVPWVASYIPKNLNMTRFPPAASSWGITYQIPEPGPLEAATFIAWHDRMQPHEPMHA